MVLVRWPWSRWPAIFAAAAFVGAGAAFESWNGIKTADHRSTSAWGVWPTGIAAAAVAAALGAVAMAYLVDPRAPHWRRSKEDRLQLAAMMSGAPLREQWLAPDTARLVARQRWQGLVIACLWVAVATGAWVGLALGDGELWPLTAPVIFAIGAPVASIRHTYRCRAIRRALTAAGVAPA